MDDRSLSRMLANFHSNVGRNSSVLFFGPAPKDIVDALKERADTITMFDPNSEDRPGKADLVICLNYLEHVGMDVFNKTIWKFHGLMNKAGFIHVQTKPMHEEVSAHVPNIPKVYETGWWWKEQIEQRQWMVTQETIGVDYYRVWVQR